MTIKNLIYKLWRRLSGGNIPDDSPYTYKELRGYIVGGVLETLKANYYEQLNSNEYRYGSDDITTTSTEEVKTDEATGLKYVDIPFQTIKVAGNRMLSITSPNPISTSAIRYVPVREEEVFVTNLQPPIPCVVLYYRSDNKAYFFNQKNLDKEVKINQKYALPTDDEADLILPESENIIIERALRLFGMLQIPSDGNNDGSANNKTIS